MTIAGRAVALEAPDPSPIKPEELPSTGRINVRKFQFLKDGKPGDGVRLSVDGVITSVHMDEDGEHFASIDFQEIIPQAKEEKPPEEQSGIIPK